MRKGAALAGVIVALVAGCGDDDASAPRATSEPEGDPQAVLDLLKKLIYEEQKYVVEVSFDPAMDLRLGAGVRIGGVRVGRVESVAESGRALLAIQPEFAPISPDTRAILRAKNLLGGTYVELTAEQPEGAPPSTGGATLDEVYESFDRETRREFKEWRKSLP